jgi:hypothetical protein
LNKKGPHHTLEKPQTKKVAPKLSKNNPRRLHPKPKRENKEAATNFKPRYLKEEE